MRSVCCKALLAAGLLALAGAAAAGEPGGEGMTARDIDQTLWASLADVINHGADLYNDGDIAGCYRVFETGLMMARPLLRHRPELQKTIQDGLADAKENPVLWKRAWALRKLLDRVRSEIRPDRGGKRPEGKKPEDKGGGDKEPEEKKTATLSGTVRADGKPLAGGKITLTPAGGSAASGKIGPDGTYEVAGVPAGETKLDIQLSLPPAPRGEMVLAGKVTLRGKPLPGGTIQFFPEKGRAASVPIGADGTYEVKLAPGGRGKLSVQIDIRPGEKKPAEKPPEKEPGDTKPDAKGGKVVSGKVTFKGKPLAGGKIRFVPAKKSAAVEAEIQADGTYEAKGVPVGEARVVIQPSDKSVKLPARYADAKTSGLTYEVKKEGDNYLDIDLND
jgi:hypothetical protein